MDMSRELSAVSLNTHPQARALGNHHVRLSPRPDSPVSAHSGSCPGSGQGKGSMVAEQRNARPFPSGFTQPGSHDLLLTSISIPNRRTSSIPFTLPSHLSMAQPASSSFRNSSDSHASITTSRKSVESDPLCSSSFCAEAIAARAAAADSTLRFKKLPQPPTATLSLSPPSSTSTPYTAPQQLALSVQAWDGSSLNVLSDGVDAHLPPIERATRHPACLTPGYSPSRPVTLHHSTSSPIPPKFSIEGVSARLSPAIITRQPHHPILSLPPIPSTSSPPNVSRRLRSQSLRSLPALPMEGSEDLEPAEHDNAVLDDLDEEEVDGDEDAGDETAETEHPDTASEDGESTSSPPSSETSRPNNLPAIDVAPLSLSLLDTTHISSIIQRDDKTPKGYGMNDYFTSKHSEPASRTPLLTSRQFSAARTSAWATPTLPTSTRRVLPTPTTPTLNPRSSVYHQASRSMSDMTEILRSQHRTPELAARTPKSPLRDPVPETDSATADTEELETKLGPSLRRRLSMPTFGPSSAPPPYPEFRFGERGPTIQPRDEEGSERLPQYTNDIYLRAIMPRKMEFSAPGVQARDRKWRRTLCILEGTVFRVYKCPSAATGKGLIGNLWEKTVGVGDIAASPAQASVLSAREQKENDIEREREARPTKLDGADSKSAQSPPSSPTSPSPSTLSQPSNESTRSRLLPPNFRRKNRASNDGPSTSRLESGGRRSFSAPLQLAQDSSASSGHRASLPASTSQPNPNSPSEPVAPALGSPRRLRTPRLKRRPLWVDDPDVPLPQEQDLLHAYALHNAESGLGSDYVKRRHVIRIRMEGQQFLLQARDVASVVDWIEVRHARLLASDDACVPGQKC